MDGEWDAARKLFIDNEDNILNVWRDNPYLDEKVKKSDVKYLEEFFDIVKDDKKFKKNIKDACRGGNDTEVGGINN